MKKVDKFSDPHGFKSKKFSDFRRKIKFGWTVIIAQRFGWFCLRLQSKQKIEKLKGESLENFYCKKWKIPVFLA